MKEIGRRQYGNPSASTVSIFHRDHPWTLRSSGSMLYPCICDKNIRNLVSQIRTSIKAMILVSDIQKATNWPCRETNTNATMLCTQRELPSELHAFPPRVLVSTYRYSTGQHCICYYRQRQSKLSPFFKISPSIDLLTTPVRDSHKD